MEWSADLSLGNDHMDSQHKDIILLMNMLMKYQRGYTSINSELSLLLLKLRTALARHFIEEEHLLEQNNCPWVEEHAVDHAYIVSILSETDTMDTKEILDQRAPLLEKKLASHLAVLDIVCRDYLSV